MSLPSPTFWSRRGGAIGCLVTDIQQGLYLFCMWARPWDKQFTVGLSYLPLLKPVGAEDVTRECISHLHCFSALVGWGKSPCLKNVSSCKNKGLKHLKSNYICIDIYIFCYVTKGPYFELYVSRCGCLNFVDCNTRYYWAPVHTYG